MPNPTDIDPIAAIRRHIGQNLIAEFVAPELRPQIGVAAVALSPEQYCARDGHRLIHDVDDFFMCRICTKRFRLAD